MQKGFLKNLSPAQRRYAIVAGVAGLAALVYLLSRPAGGAASAPADAASGTAGDTSYNASQDPSAYDASAAYPPYNLGGGDAAAIGALGSGLSDQLGRLGDSIHSSSRSQSRRIGRLTTQLRHEEAANRRLDRELARFLRHQPHGGGGGGHGNGHHHGGGGNGHHHNQHH